TGGFSVDVTDRLNSRAFYNSIFLASPGTDEDSFTNTISPCNPGDTSDLFKKAVLLRVNYFREMAGAADDITFNTTYNSKAQRAALIMLANQALNHFPPESWTCYHMDGADAADSSNLSLGNYGWNAISGQMKDNGANNTVAGHRRWIVRPRTLQMGTGDVYNATPATNDFDEAHALWVVPNVGDPVGTSAVRNTPYVAWPPPGYAPFPIVPHRWSFSIAGAGLSAAAVAVTKNGSTVPVTLETVATGYAENTLVFIPEFTGGEEDNTLNTWPQPANDTTYEVTVSGITGAPQSSYTYEVIIIDPSIRDPAEQETTISGPATPAVGFANSYTFTTIPFAEDYALRKGSLSAFSATEGGEGGTANLFDGTDASYSLISSTYKASGSNSLRLGSAFTDQYFVIERDILVSGTSSLNFKTRMSAICSSQKALAQISVDDGQSWIDVFTQAGTGTPVSQLSDCLVESGFTSRSVSLASYAGRVVKVRFLLTWLSGGIWSSTSSTVGFFVDDITVTNAQELTNISTSQLGNVSGFNFNPASVGNYMLQVQYFGWTGFAGGAWGPALSVVAVVGSTDTDGDGVPDASDNCPNDANTDQLNTDGDAAGNVCDTDDDNDGMPDSFETTYGLNPLVNDAAADNDGDGVSNLAEYTNGSNPVVNEAAVLLLLLNSEE
ncbi:MAG TPA: thrombospondin type 3 repeat-containing protein, partial [Candidatus Glassbacteria bacterium]|nr:thrombospondin type 3 repeat-containing protein [Candidatus Glassbacteria bacterium]